MRMHVPVTMPFVLRTGQHCASLVRGRGRGEGLTAHVGDALGPLVGGVKEEPHNAARVVVHAHEVAPGLAGRVLIRHVTNTQSQTSCFTFSSGGHYQLLNLSATLTALLLASCRQLLVWRLATTLSCGKHT